MSPLSNAADEKRGIRRDAARGVKPTCHPSLDAAFPRVVHSPALVVHRVSTGCLPAQEICWCTGCASAMRVSVRCLCIPVNMPLPACLSAKQPLAALWISALPAGTMRGFATVSPVCGGETHRTGNRRPGWPQGGRPRRKRARHDRRTTTMRSRHRRRTPAAPSAVGGKSDPCSTSGKTARDCSSAN